MAEASKLLEEALTLPPRERAKLAASLLDSLDPEREEEVEEAWRLEVARRVKELDDGAVETIDWTEARHLILT
jgi:putative addiction module component (TIGR02574 family)